jgi:hypothetical protein
MKFDISPCAAGLKDITPYKMMFFIDEVFPRVWLVQ